MLKLLATLGLVAGTVASALLPAASAPPTDASAAVLARGRKLVAFGACNDCHTPGWRESDGTLPVRRWMTGKAIGYRTISGTAYPTNVRLDFQALDENQWVFAAHTRGGHPPMVWSNLRRLPDSDLRAIYRFVRSLGPAGVLAPAAIPPWREPTTPYVDLRTR